MKRHINETKTIEAIGEPKVSHDQFFKYFFSKLLLALELLKLGLSHQAQQVLILEQIRSEKDSFVIKRTDLLVSVPFRVNTPNPPRLFFLIEHKSYYTRHLYKQLLAYQMSTQRRLPQWKKLLKV